MGARMLRDQLNRDGLNVGRKHVGTCKNTPDETYIVLLPTVKLAA